MLLSILLHGLYLLDHPLIFCVVRLVTSSSTIKASTIEASRQGSIAREEIQLDRQANRPFQRSLQWVCLSLKRIMKILRAASTVPFSAATASSLTVALTVLPIASVFVPFTSVASPFSIAFHYRVSPAHVSAPQLLSVPARPTAAGARPAAASAPSAALPSAARDALLPHLCSQRQPRH